MLHDTRDCSGMSFTFPIRRFLNRITKRLRTRATGFLASLLKIFSVIIFGIPVLSQTTINLVNQSHLPDFSTFPFTRPITVGSTLPSTCQVGQLYFDSAVLSGTNLYGCTATNVWTQLGGPLTTYTFSAPLSISGNTISIPQATSSTSGFLLNTDWTAFNAKQPAGNYLTGLTGDITASGPGSVATTLATVNTAPGQCGDVAHVCQITTNAKGLVTAQSAVAISVATGNISGPASSTNTAFPRWNGTGGNTLQDSQVTADANGNISTPGNISAGVGSGKAGTAVFSAGASVSCPTGSFCLMAPASIGTSFLWTLPNSDGSGNLAVNSDQISIVPGAVSAPATSSSSCVAGQWANDSTYYYVCIAANTWKRAALSSF